MLQFCFGLEFRVKNDYVMLLACMNFFHSVFHC